MNDSETTSKPAGPDRNGHEYTLLAAPNQEDDGDWGQYAVCGKCGVQENSDEAAYRCPGVIVTDEFRDWMTQILKQKRLYKRILRELVWMVQYDKPEPRKLFDRAREALAGDE